MYVNDFDPVLSDVHCAVCFTLRAKNIDRFFNHTHTVTVSQLLTHKKTPTKRKWKSGLAADFKQSLDESDINHISDTLHNLVRHFKLENAKEYWSIINGKTHDKIINDLSLEVLQEHFQK